MNSSVISCKLFASLSYQRDIIEGYYAYDVFCCVQSQFTSFLGHVYDILALQVRAGVVKSAVVAPGMAVRSSKNGEMSEWVSACANAQTWSDATIRSVASQGRRS